MKIEQREGYLIWWDEQSIKEAESYNRITENIDWEVDEEGEQ